MCITQKKEFVLFVFFFFFCAKTTDCETMSYRSYFTKEVNELLPLKSVYLAAH